MSWDNREAINGHKSFKILSGILFGPIDFPTFGKSIMSHISKATAGEMNIELLILLPTKHMGNFVDLGMDLVTL